jgi:MOSC domain-containing protein YiiM
MVERAELVLEADQGVVGDYCHGKRRHVTVVFAQDWERAERELGRPVDPSGRRANVLVSGAGGLDYSGAAMRLGACLIEVHGETRPCARMEDAAAGLMKALEPGGRAGVWGRVIQGGIVRIGDDLARA